MKQEESAIQIRSKHGKASLEEEVPDADVDRTVAKASTLGVKFFCGIPDLAARDEVNLVGALELLALPEVAGGVHYDDHGEGEVRLEEVGSVGLAIDGAHGDVELGDEDQDNENECDPGAESTHSSLEGDFIDVMALDLPSATEADVGHADRAPSE